MRRLSVCTIHVLMICSLVVAACAPRPASLVLEPYNPAPRYTKKVDMLVATTRAVGDPSNPFATSSDRSLDLNYESHTVSIPTHHTPGQIEWPDQIPPDPAYHFITTDRAPLNRDGFVRELRQRLRSSGDRTGRVLVFVHGYNMLYQESVYWMAQIVHDSGFKGAPILFAWPSAGKPTLYLADRESTTYSRDYFEKFLGGLAAVPEVKQIDILAHSMGTLLAMESLRQARMSRHERIFNKLGEVILAAPDIDVNVFRTQLDVIGPLREPMTIFVSGDDKALALSSALNGGRERVGIVTGQDESIVLGAKQYHLRIVDLTNVNDGDGSHHSKFARSSEVIAAIGQGLVQSQKQAQSQSGVVTAVTEAGNSLVKVPISVLKSVSSQ